MVAQSTISKCLKNFNQIAKKTEEKKKAEQRNINGYANHFAGEAYITTQEIAKIKEKVIEKSSKQKFFEKITSSIKFIFSKTYRAEVNKEKAALKSFVNDLVDLAYPRKISVDTVKSFQATFDRCKKTCEKADVAFTYQLITNTAGYTQATRISLNKYTDDKTQVEASFEHDSIKTAKLTGYAELYTCYYDSRENSRFHTDGQLLVGKYKKTYNPGFILFKNSGLDKSTLQLERATEISVSDHLKGLFEKHKPSIIMMRNPSNTLIIGAVQKVEDKYIWLPLANHADRALYADRDYFIQNEGKLNTLFKGYTEQGGKFELNLSNSYSVNTNGFVNLQLKKDADFQASVQLKDYAFNIENESVITVNAQKQGKPVDVDRSNILITESKNLNNISSRSTSATNSFGDDMFSDAEIVDVDND